MEMKTTNNQVSNLIKALQDLPEGERTYVTRFVTANFSLGFEDLIAKFETDKADRLDAFKKQQHRKLALLEELQDHKEDPTIAKILGLSAKTAASETSVNQGDK